MGMLFGGLIVDVPLPVMHCRLPLKNEPSEVANAQLEISVGQERNAKSFGVPNIWYDTSHGPAAAAAMMILRTQHDGGRGGGL